MPWLEQGPRDFGDLHATIDTTFLLYLYGQGQHESNMRWRIWSSQF